jgi:imidazoleglycerol-phosphate dehydratase
MTTINRETKETKIALELDCEGSGKSDIKTGVGFFDHMLESFSKHSGFDMTIRCEGDLHVDFHHTVEDVGIVLGEALKKEIFPVFEVERFGEAAIVMDEALVRSTIDLSNRPFLVYSIDISGNIGEFDSELSEEFFRALVFNAGITAHMIYERGANKHHIIEAAFKSLAVAFRRALMPNKKLAVPSTKGVL